mgnify:CR=1 FL=1
MLRPTAQPASYVSMRLLMTSMSRGQMPDRVWRHLANVAGDLPAAAAPLPENRPGVAGDPDAVGVPRGASAEPRQPGDAR